MSHSIKLKAKYIKKIKLLLLLVISPIVILISRENDYTTLRTIVALLFSIMIWTEFFHQLLIMVFRNYIIYNDNGKYLSSKVINTFRQFIYFLLIFTFYIIVLSENFSLTVTLTFLVISLILYKVTPKPIIVSQHYFMCNNQIFILDAFNDFVDNNLNSIKCILDEDQYITINISSKYKGVLLENLENTIYVKQRGMEHLDIDNNYLNVSFIRKIINYIIVFSFLVILSVPIIVDMVIPILGTDEIVTEYFMNLTILLIVLAGIINVYFTRFIVTTTKVTDFNRYNFLLHKNLRFLLVVGISALAYYHLFKIEDFVIFFLVNLVLLIYWISSVISYYIIFKKS